MRVCAAALIGLLLAPATAGAMCAQAAGCTAASLGSHRCHERGSQVSSACCCEAASSGNYLPATNAKPAPEVQPEGRLVELFAPLPALAASRQGYRPDCGGSPRDRCLLLSVLLI